MDWRRPTFSETWEIALVLLVLMTGAVLLAGLPATSTSHGRGSQPDWACTNSVLQDDSACVLRADRPMREGRAVRKGLVEPLR